MTCPTCNGVGEYPSHGYDKWYRCPTCKGTGEIGETETEDAEE